MAKMRIGKLKPANASPLWSTSCLFWRGTSLTVCPVRLRIEAANDGLGDAHVAISGGWYGSLNGSLCSTDSYISISTRGLILDVWKALADGQWSSSVAFSIFGMQIISPTRASRTLRCAPDFGSSPAAVTKSAGPWNYVVGADCTSYGSALGTLTVYDDGTMALV